MNSPACPYCGSTNVIREGLLCTPFAVIRLPRYRCRICSKTFKEGDKGFLK